MKRMLTALIALAGLTASVAMADSRDRNDHRHDDRNWDRQYNDRQYDNRQYDSRHYDNRHYDDRRFDDRRYDRWRAERRYHRGHYARPHGYRYHAWRYGERLPVAYYAPRYVVRDYRAYGLYAPPRGHHWVRVDHDVILAAVASGIVTSVVFNLFD